MSDCANSGEELVQGHHSSWLAHYFNSRLYYSRLTARPQKLRKLNPMEISRYTVLYMTGSKVSHVLEILCMHKCASRDLMQHLLFCREMSYSDWCHSDLPPDCHSLHCSPVGGVCCVAASTDWQDKVMWQYPCACA